jgi:hypothetical protein
MVADVFNTSPLNLPWHKDLIETKLVAWNELLANVVLSNEQDIF